MAGFHPDLKNLPAAFPVFPLPGALLLPRGKLPLNIFEPRYLAMIDDALGGGRMLAMIQPDASAPGSDRRPGINGARRDSCLLYTSDAADERIIV